MEFVLADIRSSMPGGGFMNIVWDAAIEHFTEKEIDKLRVDIKHRLAPGVVLSGYTIVERQDGNKDLHQHEYEFHDKEELLRFLSSHFQHVMVFETIFIYPSRHNLYYWASDTSIPFVDVWLFSTQKS